MVGVRMSKTKIALPRVDDIVGNYSLARGVIRSGSHRGFGALPVVSHRNVAYRIHSAALWGLSVGNSCASTLLHTRMQRR